MNKERFLKKLKVHIVANYDTQVEAGKVYGLSPVHMSRICTGKNEPTDAILDDMGLEKKVAEVTYVKKRKE
jgi:hypothetical protein